MKHSHYGELNLSFTKYFIVSIISQISRLSVLLFLIKKKFPEHFIVIPVVNTYGDSIHQFHQAKLYGKITNTSLSVILIEEPPAIDVAKIIFENNLIVIYEEPVFNLFRCLVPKKYRKASIDHLIYFHLRKSLSKKLYRFYDETNLPIIYSYSQNTLKGKYKNKSFEDFLNRRPYYFADFIKYSNLLSSLKDSDSYQFEVKSILKLFNIDKPYVCLHIKEIEVKMGPRIQPRGINDISTYIGLIEYLIRNNYEVILLGNKNEYINILEKYGAKAYGNSIYQSVKNDFSLIKNCQFYIGNNSGPYAVAIALRKPLLMINFIGLAEATVAADLSIYLIKKIFDKKLEKILTIQEYLQSSSFYHHNSEFFENNKEKFSIIDNTEHEIIEACKEFLEKFTTYSQCGRNLENYSQEQFEFIANLDHSHGCAYISRPVLAKINFNR